MKNKTRSIIMAAGKGICLIQYTTDSPKCLVELGGSSLLFH